MPTQPHRPCSHPGCTALVTGSPRCPAHARDTASARYDRTRRQQDPRLAAAARIRNSARWQRFRAWFRAHHPLCCDPFAEHGDMHQPCEDVHHVEPLIERPDLAFDEENCRPLCTRCHARVERIERGGDSTRKLFAAGLPSTATPGREAA